MLHDTATEWGNTVATSLNRDAHFAHRNSVGFLMRIEAGGMPGDKPLVVGTTRACFLLDCCKDKLYSFIKSGDLESYLLGDRRKITLRSIEALVEKRVAAAGGRFEPTKTQRVIPRKSKKAA
jgi:hypothetical protein